MKLTDLQIEAIKNDKNPERYGWKTMLLALIEENGKLEKALAQTRECLWWTFDLHRFGHEIKEEDWNFIGNLLGADMES